MESNFERPSSNSAETKQEKNKKVLAQMVSGRLKNSFKEARIENSELSHEELAAKALDILKQRLLVAIPERESELDELFKNFYLLTALDKNELVDNVSLSVAEFILARYSTEEIERIARQRSQYENFHLNRLIDYGISGDMVHIHTPVTFIENPIELRGLFVDALQKLAEELKNNPKLSNVTKVTANSWIVAKAQRSFRDAGFTITELSDDGKKGFAEISREKLIEMYGIKNP